MKLLFDHNLSPHLVGRLSDIYPNANHVSLVGLDQANDDLVWQYARNNDYIIVTQDSDFNELVVFRGVPPKLVWIRLGNRKTGEIEAILRQYYEGIKTLSEDPSLGTLTIS